MTECQQTPTTGEPVAPVVREVAAPASPVLQIVTGVFAIVVAALLTYFARSTDLTEWQPWARTVLAVLRDLLLAGGVLTVVAAVWAVRPRKRSRASGA